MAAIAAITHGRPPGPTRPTIVATMRLAPPESSSSLPIIAPSAMRMPTAPAVAPNPATKLLTVSPGGIVATTPSTAEPEHQGEERVHLAPGDEHDDGEDAEHAGRDRAARCRRTPGGSSADGSRPEGRGHERREVRERHQACSFRWPSAASARSRTWAALPSLVMATPGSSSPSGSSVASWLGSSDGGM